MEIVKKKNKTKKHIFKNQFDIILSYTELFNLHFL